MSKELNSWEEVKAYLEYVLYDKRGTRAIACTSTSGYLQPFIDDVEKQLKALEIIKSKEMLSVFKDINGKCYLAFNTTAIEIPQEEYELLKEVLL